MEGLPEYEPDLEEEYEYPRKSFGIGFITGILFTLVVIMVIVIGYFHWRKYSPSRDLGASVLTDPATGVKIAQVEKLIEDNYLNDIDSEELEAYIFRGIAAGLLDPYAIYYTAEELKEYQNSSQGSYYGLGVTIAQRKDTMKLEVVQVYEDSPAMESGLQAGDILLAVNGTSVEGKEVNDVVNVIQSMKSDFELEISRPETGEQMVLTVHCEEVEIYALEYEMLSDGTGYIHIKDFTIASIEQFRNAILDLQDQGMQRLLVDLRNNPGGRLEAVCAMLDAILPEGLIVYTERRNGERTEYRSDEQQLITCPIGVWVNKNTASASEIFAGAVQDYALGPVIGEQTFGKGIVQTTYSLYDGSAIKMTVEKYFTPKGQDIHGNGITPDVLLDAEADTAQAAEELMNW